MLTSVKKLFWDWDARNLRSLRNASTHLENVAFAIQTRVAVLSGSHDVSSFINNATYYHIALQKRLFVFRNVKTEMITKDVFSREKLCHVVGCGGAFFSTKKRHVWNQTSPVQPLCSTPRPVQNLESSLFDRIFDRLLAIRPQNAGIHQQNVSAPRICALA